MINKLLKAKGKLVDNDIVYNKSIMDMTDTSVSINRSRILSKDYSPL